MEPMESIRLILAAKMRERRKSLKINQDGLAERSRLSVDTIKKVEAGDRWPSPETLEAISNGLGVGIDELFQGEIKRQTQAPVSQLLRRLSAIPDKIYDQAEKVPPNHEAWNVIEDLLRVAAKDVEDKARAKKNHA